MVLVLVACGVEPQDRPAPDADTDRILVERWYYDAVHAKNEELAKRLRECEAR